ncbi:hypothetical protein VTL71DRAFT_7665 [Oculimacula yallundae]|uniref:DUF5071 domain-containing protein n=1 Tax=Oculimacula yallundae TaxID=86028 RepID=A0ABR4BUV3_9HELO
MDVEAMRYLTTLDADTLAPLIPHLLTWIQDINWPVASPVIHLLRKYPFVIVEPVRKVLRDEAGEKDDGGWKFNCLNYLVVEMNPEYQILLNEEIVRMATSPTKEEAEWETVEIAKDILRKLHLAVQK